MSFLDQALSTAASWLRTGAGSRVGRLGARPVAPFVLYEFEGCPFCRKVREALSILDLDADVLPCPKRGTRFREELVARGGKAQFPYLVDPGAGVELYESDAIVRHLFTRYGDGPVPWQIAGGPLGDASAVAVGLARPGLGSFVRPAKAPARPLELFGFEASAGCRRVRERLCVLELPYRLHNRAEGSARSRPEGSLPHLLDPNGDVALSGAEPILAYLEATYAA